MDKLNFWDSFLTSIKAFFGNIYYLTAGLLTSIFGYLVPTKDMVNFLILLFVIDVFFGWLVSRKIRKEKFQPKIIWEKTVPRMLISILLVVVAFTWDNLHGQNFICTYKSVSYFLSGMLIYSFAINAFKLTNWDVFKKLGSILKSKIDKNIGNSNEKTDTENETTP